MVANSQEPHDPPRGTDRVIGLCGQGGRHPYFELSLEHVDRAVKQILKGPPRLDFVQGVCEQLRALTLFNAGTGCINDRRPALVPLMAPDEIWCNGTEVALDLWRLLAFDVDYVSSAAQLGLDPTDMAIGSPSYNAVAFSNMMKACGDAAISFDVVESGFPKPLSSSSSSSLTVSLRQLFLEAGSLLTPADPYDLAQWYAAVRYLHWIDSAKGDLRVKDSFASDPIDTRYRGLFSEEVGIGMMAVLLRERYGVSLITNTAEYHALRGIEHEGTVADFVAEGIHPRNATPLTIIAESKGAIRQRVPKGRRGHAKSQIAATPYVVRGTEDVLGLAFASSLRYTHQRDRSYCEVIDPEASEDCTVFDPVYGYRLAYAKALRFAGMEAAARQTYRGEPALSLPDPELQRAEMRHDDIRGRRTQHRSSFCRQALQAELIRDMGDSGFVVDTRIMRALRSGLTARTVESIRSQVADTRRATRKHRASFVNSLGIGLVSFDDPPMSR